MSITQAKLDQYKALIASNLKNTLTSSQYAIATSDKAIKMLEAEAGGDGSTATGAATFVGWLKSNPKAMTFLTGSSDAAKDFQNIISGNVTFTTAADALPSTYIALHAETPANEPKLAGLLALRNAGLGTGSGTGVDSTFKTDGANLGAGAAGTVLTDAYVMGLYATWGAAKFNAIFNNGTLKAIANESNASYDTIAEVAALYSAWSSTVSVSSFFAGLQKMVDAGVSGLKFSDLMGLANNATNFNKYTSDAAITLMASSGGSFSAVTGLSAAEFTALTSINAVNAIKHGGADYTLLHAVYTADTTKLNSLLSDNSLNLAMKGYTGVDIPALSTGYGTTYTLPADAKFNAVVDPGFYTLFANGTTYANVAAAHTANLLHGFTPAVIEQLVKDPGNFNANVGVLVSGSLSDYSGLDAMGFQG
jgi:hypothetical protein